VYESRYTAEHLGNVVMCDKKLLDTIEKIIDDGRAYVLSQRKVVPDTEYISKINNNLISINRLRKDRRSRFTKSIHKILLGY